MELTHTALTFDRCPACDAAKFPTVRGFEKKFLRRCASCGLVFDHRIPSPSELFEYYRRYSYGALRPCPAPTRASYARLLGEFERFRQVGRILDIGCGQGDFLLQASEAGWTAQGSEFSEAAVALCKARGIDARQGSLAQAGFAPGSFDVITSFEVLEHVNTPAALLQQVRDLLRPGGLFYLTTPNFNAALRFGEKANFEMLCYPEHLCFYTGRSIRRLARANGFDPVKVLTTGIDLRRAKAVARGRSDRPTHENIAQKRGERDALREQLNTRPVLRLAKGFVNAVLTATGLGDTLKAYLVKRS